MKYISVAEAAVKWGISERSVRNYCAKGRVNGAFLTGKTWNIPEAAVKPERKRSTEKKPETLAEILKDEKKSHRKGVSLRDLISWKNIGIVWRNLAMPIFSVLWAVRLRQ